ncbi:MAG: BRO family protein [Bacilli bacterium]
MNNNKLETITNLFENKEIRSLWDAEKEEYFFSVVDVVSALTNSPNPNNYWNMLKKRMSSEEKSELYTNCVQLKLKSTDGKFYKTDTLDTKGIFRLIESVPSPNAEPFKMWLATLGKERIDEVFDPEIAVNRAITYYRNCGYSDEWIKSRLTGILDRHKLTDVWKENGIKENYEYAILTNEIYKTWSGMKASEYKTFKGIRKESLRDNMTDIEVALTNLSEIATREIAKVKKPYGLEQNKSVARKGGTIAKNAKDSIEKETMVSVISKTNSLNYQYIDEFKQITEENNKATN